MLFSIKKNICTKQSDPLFHVDKSIKMRKDYGTKRNQGTFRIDKNVQLIVISRELTMTLMRLNILIVWQHYVIYKEVTRLVQVDQTQLADAFIQTEKSISHELHPSQ